MTVTSGIVGNTQYNPNNCLIFSLSGGDLSYTNGTTIHFNNVVNSGSNSACTLDTSTGVFTCNFPGTYIIWAVPNFYNLPSSGTLGMQSDIYVDGSLYQTSQSNGLLVAWNRNQQFIAMTFATMLPVTVPGTTFYFVVNTTSAQTWAFQSGSRGDVLYIA